MYRVFAVVFALLCASVSAPLMAQTATPQDIAQPEKSASRTPAIFPTRLGWRAEPLIHIDRRHACFDPGLPARVEVKRPDDDATFETDGKTLMRERQGRCFDGGLDRLVPGSIEPALFSRHAKQASNLFV